MKSNFNFFGLITQTFFEAFSHAEENQRDHGGSGGEFDLHSLESHGIESLLCA